ncbi:MAG: hypothetical protein IKW11_05175 [Bacteroidales bacterium]|nr:hypothetical protein [Bacteroidales bacterium]
MKGSSALLLITTILLVVVLFLSLTNYKETQIIRQENAILWAKIDSVQQLCEGTPRKTPKTAAKPSNRNTAPVRVKEEQPQQTTKVTGDQKIVVSTKYRLEDRYNRSGIYEPEFLGNEIGEVILTIYVDYSGDVKSAKLKSANGITNEDVIEACKKAALRTDFNIDVSSNDLKVGTITYIFSVK